MAPSRTIGEQTVLDRTDEGRGSAMDFSTGNDIPVDDAAAVDEANLPVATGPRGFEILACDVAHLGRAERMEVQHVLDRDLDRLVIHGNDYAILSNSIRVEENRWSCSITLPAR